MGRLVIEPQGEEMNGGKMMDAFGMYNLKNTHTQTHGPFLPAGPRYLSAAHQ